MYKSIVLFITKNHTVHRFNVCTRNIIQIENHEYIYQITAVRDSVPIAYFHKSNFHVETYINIYKCIIIIITISKTYHVISVL